MTRPLTITEFRDDPDEALRRAESGPVTITSHGKPIARLALARDDAPTQAHARDAAGMFRHLVREPVSLEDMKASVRRRAAERARG